MFGNFRDFGDFGDFDDFEDSEDFDDLNELYAEFESTDAERMTAIKLAQLKPTEMTVDFLTFVYEDIKKDDFLESFQERHEQFQLPLHAWCDWLQTIYDGDIVINHVFTYLKEEKGAVDLADSAVVIQARVGENDVLIIFFGKDMLTESFAQFKLADLIDPQTELHFNLRGTSHINMSAVDEFRNVFASGIMPMKYEDLVKEGHFRTYFAHGSDWASFTAGNIAREGDATSHFIFLYD